MFPRAKFPAQSTQLNSFLKKGNDTQAFLTRNSMRRLSLETSLQYRLYSSVMLVVCGNIWFLDSCNVLFGTAPTRVNHRFPYLRNFTPCHDGTCFICLFSTNQNDLRNKSNINHLEPLKVYENVLKQKRMTFPPIFLGITAHFTMVLKALILLEEEVKNSNTMYVFCTWCSTKWKNWFRIKGAHLAALPKKASRTVQTDNESWKDLPVRPNSDPHYPLPLAPYIRIYRNPESY